jgi:hypothetical protein
MVQNSYEWYANKLKQFCDSPTLRKISGHDEVTIEPQLADPFLARILDHFSNRQIRLADRLLAEKLLRDCLAPEKSEGSD